MENTTYIDLVIFTCFHLFMWHLNIRYWTGSCYTNIPLCWCRHLWKIYCSGCL